MRVIVPKQNADQDSQKEPVDIFFAAGLLLALGLAACGAQKASIPDPAPVLPAPPPPLYYLIDLTGTATSGSTTLTNMTNIELNVS